VDIHREVFAWVLGVLSKRELLRGKRIAIDATDVTGAFCAKRNVRETGTKGAGAYTRRKHSSEQILALGAMNSGVAFRAQGDQVLI
jgi:hypothetical protein